MIITDRRAPHTMKTRLLAGTAVIIAATLLSTGCDLKQDSTPISTPTSSAQAVIIHAIPSTPAPKITRITEDDPNFNCLTMGNHRCGPTWARGHGHHINCMAKEVICLANLRAGSTWTSISGPIDGHSPCAQLLGDTTLYACKDGYLTSS